MEINSLILSKIKIDKTLLKITKKVLLLLLLLVSQSFFFVFLQKKLLTLARYDEHRFKTFWG